MMINSQQRALRCVETGAIRVFNVQLLADWLGYSAALDSGLWTDEFEVNNKLEVAIIDYGEQDGQD